MSVSIPESECLKINEAVAYKKVIGCNNVNKLKGLVGKDVCVLGEM
jgi:hypothetical protein